MSAFGRRIAAEVSALHGRIFPASRDDEWRHRHARDVRDMGCLSNMPPSAQRQIKASARRQRTGKAGQPEAVPREQQADVAPACLEQHRRIASCP